MMDALRLLPVLGLLLWLVPLFWPADNSQADATAPVMMSVAVTYVFLVWIALIALAFSLWFALWASRKSGNSTETALSTDEAGK